MRKLVQPLFEGPIDIVGDIHGEIDAIAALLRHLGYDDAGKHPERRRLVFLGDLTDRGPDSPAVVTLVQSLVEAGRAQCVLGNHDLNILLGDRKHDNHWFFGETWSLDGSDQATPAKLADDDIRQRVLSFFGSLPLALERDNVRVVHACWDDSMIEIARHSTDAVALFREHAAQIDAGLKSRPELDDIDRALEHQNRNPVKVLTSGKEQRVEQPFESSGKLRYQQRIEWWQQYESDPFCLFGHYSAFGGHRSPSSRAICIDFAVAKRWQERIAPNFDDQYQGQLAAVRLPSGCIVFDNGGVERIEHLFR